MWEDPIVAEIRCIREQLAAKYNFDVAAIFAEMRKRQSQLGSRLVNREKKKETDGEAMAKDCTPLYSGR